MGLHIKTLNIAGYEKVIEIQDRTCGLHAFIAIHDTTLGPALGGIRFLPYNTPQDALKDVLRLAKGMTYKSAIADLKAGGGKSTVIWDPNYPKPKELLQSFAEAINSLNGLYVGAEDMNCLLSDIETMHKFSPHILGLPGDGTGDPARFTARGVFVGIQATAQYLWGSDSLRGKKIAIQGAGGVGEKLIQHLFWAGANLYVSDLRPDVLKYICHEYGAQAVACDQIYDLECDIFVPCAQGAILNPDTIPRLNCKAVVGAANNQLLHLKDSLLLKDKGILYAPDYLVNGGGVISVASAMPLNDSHPQKVLFQADKTYDRLLSIYQRADKEGICPSTAADKYVEEKLSGIKEKQNALV